MLVKQTKVINTYHTEPALCLPALMGQLTEVTGVVYRQLTQRAQAVEQVCTAHVNCHI